jgi:hypothetical protein
MRFRSVRGAVGLVAGAVLLGGCPPFFVPCGTFSPSIEGSWQLVNANGAPIPAGGLLLDSGDRLAAGTLTFKTERITSCTDDAREEAGSVIATYNLVGQTDEVYAGAFRRTTSAGSSRSDVTVSANGQAVKGTLVDGSLQFAGTLPEFGSITADFAR